MINAIVGRPRAGKSYESVIYHIIPAAMEGRLVVTNIPVNKEAVAKFYTQAAADLIIHVKANFTDYGMIRPFATPDDYTKYDWKNEKGQGPLFVVDEAHLAIGRDAKKEVLEYLSMHGHYGHDIIMVTQDPQKLHRDLKSMVEVCWRCIKKSVFGDDKHYIKKTYHGVGGRNEDFVHEEEREYKTQFFQFYQSHTQSSSAVDEAKPKDVQAVMFPRKKLIIGMLIIAVPMALFFGAKMIAPSEPAKTKTSNVPTQQTQAQVQQVSTPTASTAPVRTAPVSSKPDIPKHPFYKVTLHLDGIAFYTLKGREYKESYFVATQNGQPVFNIASADLRMAGYDVAVYGECLVRLTYNDIYDDWITCDSPQIALSEPTSKPSEPESGVQEGTRLREGSQTIANSESGFK